jgi:hypothetical protein
MPGAPAVEPAKIASAGFVLRWRDDGGREQGFQLVRARPLGWQPIDDPKADPDLARRARLFGIALPPTPASAYTGEEVHPLHALLIEPANARPHTLLFGYLPIGGAEFLPPSPTPPPPDLPDEVPWPFGMAGRSNGPPPWSLDLAWQMKSATIQPALAAVLRLLLTGYGFARSSSLTNSENAALLAALNRMSFFAGGGPSSGLQPVTAWAAAHGVQDANGAPLTLGAWLAQLSQIPAAGSTPSDPTYLSDGLLNALMVGDLKSPVTLPAGLVPPGGGNLLVAENDAIALRAALQTRRSAAWADNISQFPLPKYAVGTGRKFYVKPFARIVRPDGCERLYWGAPSEQFLLASPFDPDATRPVLIQMPALSDAKRGMARGAAFMMPPDLADVVNRLTNKDAVQNELNGQPQSTGLGLGFICSFSIPVITICAMLLLSLIIALLNIAFFWLPFVKICLPVPRNMRGLPR